MSKTNQIKTLPQTRIHEDKDTRLSSVKGKVACITVKAEEERTFVRKVKTEELQLACGRLSYSNKDGKQFSLPVMCVEKFKIGTKWKWLTLSLHIALGLTLGFAGVGMLVYLEGAAAVLGQFLTGLLAVLLILAGIGAGGVGFEESKYRLLAISLEEGRGAIQVPTEIDPSLESIGKIQEVIEQNRANKSIDRDGGGDHNGRCGV